MFGSSRKSQDETSLRDFREAYTSAGREVQLLVRASDLYPVYISGNFNRIFGVAPQRLKDDIETLFRFISGSERRIIQHQVQEWDRLLPLNLQFWYESPRNKAVSRETQPVEQDEEEQDLRQLFRVRVSYVAKQGNYLATYLLSLVNDVLDMSRLDSGRVELDPQPFDMLLVAKELQSMFMQQALDKKLEYTVNTSPEDDRFLIGDKMRLNQIVVNFISNALKFTAPGGQVTITIKEMYQEGDSARFMIRVKDTGKGMDPRFLSRIFKPFEQEDASISRKYGGTGLGMAITDSLTKLMDGEIVVESELGKGSEFAVYIPFGLATQEQIDALYEAGEVMVDSPEEQQEEAIPDYNMDGKLYLMAEDNDINAMISEMLLSEHGASIERATDGTVAVEMFENSEPGHYDAVLMDIQMPTMNGWDASRAIRALDREDAKFIPIVALTANAYAEDVRRSREAGMNGHVLKPIEFDNLYEQLAKASEACRKEKEKR